MDFIPKSDGALYMWLQNYKSKIAPIGGSLGFDPTEIKEEQDCCDQMLASLDASQQAKDVYAAKVAEKNQLYQEKVGLLRTNIGRHKKAVGFTESMAQDLGVASIASGFDVNSYKAQISADLYGGWVRIKFKKLGADGVNIYHRQKGAATWLFLARVTRSPFDDHFQLAVPNQPEHWEYMGYGVVNDEQIGHASDIVGVVFG